MKTKLKLVLDQLSVNDAMMSMAKEIGMIGCPLAIIAILKGGAYTAYELLKRLSLIYEKERIGFFRGGEEKPDIVIGHIGLESYGQEMKSQGEVKLMTPLDLSRECLRGRKVVIIDDCIETGCTLDEAKKIILGYEPLQVYTAVLVDKVTLRMDAKTEKPDIIGWSYSDTGFLVGCGMGAGEKYRGLPEIHEVVEDKK